MIFYREQKAHEDGRQPADAAGNFLRSRKKIPAIFSLFPHSVASVSSSELCERVRDLRHLSGLPRTVRGFTLIELLIVMVVISIMVGITIPISKYVTYRARVANQRIYIEKIKSALEDYRAAYGEYPITPTNNAAGVTLNLEDVKRHYPTNYFTECYYTTNSPYTSVGLATNTVESIITGSSTPNYIDYCLTYPLMLKQREAGARPFMDFKEVTVAFLVYRSKGYVGAGGDAYSIKRKRKTKGGSITFREFLGMYGNPVDRPKAIDPVSMKQWKYTSENGVTYNLTTNSF